MIISKAPLRISFFGGGSDIPDHYLKHSGATISMAINKYVYVALMPTPYNHIKVSYSEHELVEDVDDIKNDIVRESLKWFNITSNIEITTFADIPTIGTGLGGSSAFTCALVAALAKFKGYNFSAYDIANTACHIEIDMCGWSIGKQDQYASAFGGMNYIKYGMYSHEDPWGEMIQDNVQVTKIDHNNIDKYCILIPSFIQRHSSEILKEISFLEKSYVLQDLSAIATKLSTYQPLINYYGTNLNICWNLKRGLSDSVSNKVIDDMYDTCIEAGAEGCKLLGAGGGGYMLALTYEKSKIKKAFSDRLCLDVNISHEGAKIVYVD